MPSVRTWSVRTWSVRIGRSVLEKYFLSVSEASLDIRSPAASETSEKYFSVRTSQPVNKIYIHKYSSSSQLKFSETHVLVTCTELSNIIAQWSHAFMLGGHVNSIDYNSQRFHFEGNFLLKGNFCKVNEI